MRNRVVAVVALAVLLCGCRRQESGTFITAPFNDQTRIAKVVAHWTTPAQEAPTRFEVRVENRLADRLYVRLSRFALVDSHGEPLARSPATGDCVLPAQGAGLVLSGTLESPAAEVGGFAVESFGVPLSERGRGIYREFLLQSQKHTAAEVDQELARYAAAPTCP